MSENFIAKETITVSLEEEMKQSYLDYAMSVVVSRALPDARDGMKPVHRRVLYLFHLNKSFVKRTIPCHLLVFCHYIGSYWNYDLSANQTKKD